MKYFNNKNWSQITREERLFCAELFFEIKNDPKPFLELIGKQNKVYEIAYEVCFYRDVLHANKIGVKSTYLPQKRTFDLALFSEDEIVIIEAKSQQGFGNNQLKSFEADNLNINKLFEIIKLPMPKVTLIAICSSKYNPKKESVGNFSQIISWAELATIYPKKETIFLSADNSFVNKI